MGDESQPVDLSHLADDLLFPEPEAEEPETSPSSAASSKESGPEIVGSYQLIKKFRGNELVNAYLAHKFSQFGFLRKAIVKRARLDDELYEITKEMLLDEARALASLDHPNIVSLLDLTDDENGTCLALEYVDGTDLRQVNDTMYARKEALPLELACYIAIEVLRALEHTHLAVDEEGQPLNLMHRDINPANILISRHGRVKLTDFGVVRMGNRLQEQTQPASIRGKFSYMSREQILGQSCDGRMDIYALGIVLLEMLTGKPCFGKLEVQEMMKRVVEHDLPMHRLEKQNVPAALIAIVQKATAKSPDDRFISAKVMADQLETWLVKTGRHISASIVSAFFAQHTLFVEPRFASVRSSEHVVSTPEVLEQETSQADATDIDKKKDVDTGDITEAQYGTIEQAEERSPEELLQNVPVDKLDRATDDALAEYVMQEDVSGPVELLTEQDFDESAAETDAAQLPETAEETGSVPPSVRLTPVGNATASAPIEPEPVRKFDHIDLSDSWSENIRDVSVAEALEHLVRNRASGSIHFEHSSITKEVFISSGRCVAIRSNVGMEDLSEMLVTQKVLSRFELERMVMGRPMSDTVLGQKLVQAKKTTPERFAKIHGQQIQQCLEDVVGWRAGKFTFRAMQVDAPSVFPSLQIELLLLAHLDESQP